MNPTVNSGTSSTAITLATQSNCFIFDVNLMLELHSSKEWNSDPLMYQTVIVTIVGLIRRRYGLDVCSNMITQMLFDRMLDMPVSDGTSFGGSFCVSGLHIGDERTLCDKLIYDKMSVTQQLVTQNENLQSIVCEFRYALEFSFSPMLFSAADLYRRKGYKKVAGDYGSGWETFDSADSVRSHAVEYDYQKIWDAACRSFKTFN